MRAKRAGAALLLALLGAAPRALASETDNLTFRFVVLEDSAPKVNAKLNELLEQIRKDANATLRESSSPRLATDTEAELAFMKAYRARILKKFHSRLVPVFELCIERNDCAEWPRFERIALRRAESIFGESRYNLGAIAFLASSIELCGVRLGTDKTTHLFSNGFFYYNGSRREGSRLVTPGDAYAWAMADERGLFGARSNAVVSSADAEATAAGFRLSSDYFLGEDPVFARDAESGEIVKRRDVDVCRYVNDRMDEGRNVPAYTAGKKKTTRLEKAIEERRVSNARAERSLGAEERRAVKEELVKRPIDPEHGRLSIPQRTFLALRLAWAYLTLPSASRRAANLIVFPKFDLERRKPLVIRREPAAPPH
ncbi:MAG TPA: hypothetical protein VGR00_08455 [Thermoanaerobaculia bacterium]|nr:hypothetical protein [Thermoanaerobaculia bacterium]